MTGTDSLPTGTQEGYLTNHFLVSMPQLEDDNFCRTVTLICQHDENGALGVVINRLTEHTLGDIYQQLEIVATDPAACAMPVFEGGPVHQEFGLVIHSHEPNQSWQSTIRIGDRLALTSSRDILEAIADARGPDDYLVLLGFSGWASGQLESELQQNSWLTSSCNADLLFHEKPEDKWQVAFDSLGFDINSLSPVSGNA